MSDTSIINNNNNTTPTCKAPYMALPSIKSHVVQLIIGGCWVTPVSCHFRRCYLKADQVSKVKAPGKLDRHVILESVLTLFTKNYQNWSVFVETTTCQEAARFW